MITWQEVADKSAILGSAPAEIGVAEWDFGPFFGTQTYTSDWFGGTIAFSAIGENGDVEAGIVSSSQNVDSYSNTYGYDPTFVESNGSGTTSWKAVTRSAIEGDELEDFVNIGTFTVSSTNSTWSQQTLILNSYELTTLTGQSGKTTTTSATHTTVPSTSLFVDSVISTAFNQPITRVTTTNTTIFERASFTGSAYTTTLFTGQTTVAKYSSFSHNIPLIYTTDTATTASSGQKTYSCEPRFGSGETNPTSTATIATTSGSHDQTRNGTIAGSIVSAGGNGPSVVAGSTQIVSSQYSAVKYTTTTQTFTYAGTTETTQTFATSETILFADVSGVVTFTSTSTHPTAAADFASSYSFVETTGTGSLTGIFDIKELHQFAAATSGRLSEAERIEIGVRAASSQEAGAAIEEDGRKNAYSRQSSSVFLAVSSVLKSSNGRTSFFANQFTQTDAEGETSSNSFSAQGAAVSHWQNANGVLGGATIIGGKLSGAAVILAGVYATYAGINSGFTTVTSPFATAWEPSTDTAATYASTAYLPNSFTTGTGTNAVQVLSRHVTTIVDE